MAINYRDYTWENLPSTSTPTSAANFNAMEAGIKAACDELDARPVIRAAALTSDFNCTQSNTTYEDVTGLAIAAAANEIITFTIRLLYNTGLTPDIKFQFTIPAGATLKYFQEEIVLNGGTSFTAVPTVKDDSDEMWLNGHATLDQVLILSGVLLNSSTAGDLQIQAAQLTSDASTTNVLAGSIIRAEVWT